MSTILEETLRIVKTVFKLHLAVYFLGAIRMLKEKIGLINWKSSSLFYAKENGEWTLD